MLFLCLSFYRPKRDKTTACVGSFSQAIKQIRPDLVLAAISSQVPTVLDEDEILLSTSELGAAGLPKPSIIKLGKIFTIHQGLIRKKLGNIGEATLEDVRRKLVELMR